MKKTVYDEIREFLPWDYRVDLAKKCGCHRNSVYLILKGERSDNFGLIPKAYDLASKKIQEAKAKEKAKRKFKRVKTS